MAYELFNKFSQKLPGWQWTRVQKVIWLNDDKSELNQVCWIIAYPTKVKSLVNGAEWIKQAFLIDTPTLLELIDSINVNSEF